MPRYRVYEVQEEIFTRKWMYEIEASDENAAMMCADNGEADPTDRGTIGEPFYGDSGFAAQLAEAPDDDSKWEEASANLGTVKCEDYSPSTPPEDILVHQVSASVPPTVIEAIEAALSYFEDTRHGKEWTQAGGVEAGLLRSALQSLRANDSQQPRVVVVVEGGVVQSILADRTINVDVLDHDNWDAVRKAEPGTGDCDPEENSRFSALLAECQSDKLTEVY